MKQNIALFFGGVSCEHDISIITGIQVLNNLDEKYEVYPVYIHGDGVWYSGQKLKDIRIFDNFETYKNSLKKVCILPYSRNLYAHKKNKLRFLCTLDAAVLAMHGLNGEDGSIAGLMQLAGIPQTSCSVLGGSMGMDKIAMKIFFEGLKLNVLPYMYIDRREYMFDSLSTLRKIEETLSYPIIIKPSMLGSSIGINICNSRAELISGIEVAMRFDRRILFERAEKNFTEINCSAFKINGVIRTTECERPVSWTDYLKFEDKYLSGGKGMAGTNRIFPADIDKKTSDEIKETVIKIYRSLNLKGVIRADFIISDAVYINEINTIPGSLSYYLWEYEGIKFKNLLDIMIKEASEDIRDLNKCTLSFKSDVLKSSFCGKTVKK
jgi:D-alanine-D-alanine ligase